MTEYQHPAEDNMKFATLVDAVVCEIRKKVKSTELKEIVAGIRRAITDSHGINAARIALFKARTILKSTSGQTRSASFLIRKW